jgi:hypothetical protein
MHPRSGSEDGLVGCVENDRRALAGSIAQEGVVLVVPVHDDLLGSKTGGAGKCQLAGGGDIDSEPLFTQQLQDRDIGESLCPERDMSPRHRRLQRPGASSERALAVDDKRRAELVCESGRPQPAEHEIRPLATCRVREQAD